MVWSLCYGGWGKSCFIYLGYYYIHNNEGCNVTRMTGYHLTTDYKNRQSRLLVYLLCQRIKISSNLPFHIEFIIHDNIVLLHKVDYNLKCIFIF